MDVSFDALPPTARVWIYQASRALTGAELAAVGPHLARFAAEWTSHGAALRAAAEFRHGQFLVIGLDEAVAGASGCSIDASVRFVGELEKALGLALLDKSHLAFAGPDGLLLLERSVPAATAGSTWLARYFVPVGEAAATGPAPA